MKILLKIRNDSFGSGAFGSPRTRNGISYKHTGEDYACVPGSMVLSDVEGTIIRNGFCYEGNKILQLTVIKDRQGYQHKYLYITPTHEAGDEVKAGDIIGVSLSLQLKHPPKQGERMTDHVHYEICLGSTIIEPAKWRGAFGK